MTNPTTALPPRLRLWLYWLYAFIGAFLGGVEVWGSETLFGADVTRILAVFAYAGIALGITAGSNVPSYADVVAGDAEPPAELDYAPEHRRDEAGESSLVLVLAVVGVVLLVLLLVGVLR